MFNLLLFSKLHLLLCAFVNCVLCCSLPVFVDLFFFMQKTAYEMRISDWSSDVCSSDLMKAKKAVSGAPRWTTATPPSVESDLYPASIVTRPLWFALTTRASTDSETSNGGSAPPVRSQSRYCLSMKT